MTKYREILRLSSLGFSNRNIALSVPCSRNTVAKVLKRAQELDISWPLEDNQTDGVLESLFYPKQSDRSQKRMPDYDYIHKELLRNGVSKKLLWTEYMEGCRANGDEPLMYSQFCYHIQQDEQKRRATMHINRKPGEQVQVLILDEWMLLKPTETEQKDIFELFHRRRKKSSTIFCSQYVFEEWYDQLGGEASPLADAIIDRIAMTAIRSALQALMLSMTDPCGRYTA